jgi:hypothetical protein
MEHANRDLALQAGFAAVCVGFNPTDRQRLLDRCDLDT